ncbi:MAG: anthranilate synthase component I, partial [Candidatus Micropelagos thuwalensis]|nr:anthranilate synthase component I [Candidatus Micropelagos thuwalensis]
MTEKFSSNLAPSRADFVKAYNDGKIQLVSRKLSSDLETPVSVYLKLCQDESHSFLMESVQDGEIRGRYSM